MAVRPSRATSLEAITGALRGSRPRTVGLNGSGIVLVVVAIAVIAGGLVGSGLLWRKAQQDTRVSTALDTSGIGAEAHVTSLWRERGENQHTWVAYRFVARDRPVESRTRIPSSLWTTLRVGSALPIQFLPDDPGVSRVTGVSGRGIPSWIVGVVLVASMGPGALIALAISREWTLVRDGRAASAVVTRHVKRSAHEGGTYWSIVYEFPLLDGRRVSGRSRASRTRPPIGAQIAVLYDPDRPKRNLTYPAQFVRLA